MAAETAVIESGSAAGTKSESLNSEQQNVNSESVVVVNSEVKDYKDVAKSEYKMEDIVNMLKKLKLNPQAKEFVPSYCYSSNNNNYHGDQMLLNNFMMPVMKIVGGTDDSRNNGKRGNSCNQGRRRMNNRALRAQREDSIRRTVYVSDIDHNITEERLAALFSAYGQGFRKIDADKWEFANEGFLRGKKHLLKNIQRRKSHQAGSSLGSSAEAGKATVDEIEKLKKERSLMMQEVVELQQQQRGTVQQMESVNEKLVAAEQKQKQMVSFLAKVFQNPTFFGRIRQMKEQGEITSSRTMRKFIKHQPHDSSREESSMEGQIVKYRPDFQDLATSFESPPFNPVVDQQLPETVASEGLTTAHGFLKNPDRVVEGASGFNPDGSHFKGKNVVSPQLEVMPEYFSFPEELEEERNVSGFSPGIESMMKEEEVWSMGFEASAGMSSTGTELWGGLGNYVPDFGVSSGLSDLWDLDPLLAAGGSGVDKWPDDESPFGQSENQVNQPKSDDSF